MLRLLKLLIWGHVHTWETLARCDLQRDTGSTGHRYVLRCTTCGDVQKRDLI